VFVDRLLEGPQRGWVFTLSEFGVDFEDVPIDFPGCRDFFGCEACALGVFAGAEKTLTLGQFGSLGKRRDRDEDRQQRAQARDAAGGISLVSL
jgi:hypothetical protein